MKLCPWLLIVSLAAASNAFASDWPQWRGPERDGHSPETGLLQEWPQDGPPLRWTAADIGTGYSSPVVAGGRVYVQTTRGDEELAVSLDEQSGRTIWSVPIGTIGRNRGPQYPGTRSSPTVDGNRIYCLASAGELVCLDAASGARQWQRHLVDDFGGKPGNWAYSESVLIDGDHLICTPGGEKATLASLDKLTGEVAWESAVPGGSEADYASIVIAQASNVRQYVSFLRGGLTGIEAETGRFLWKYDRSSDRAANILTPIVVENRVFSSGSRSGGGLIRITADGEEFAAEEVYFDRALTASIGGAVLVDGSLYGTSRRVMFCADFATGDIKWSDGALGAASLCYADGRLYAREHDSGDVVLVEPSPEAYREKGRFVQPERSTARAWPHPVVANGGLYLRDEGVLLCYNISAAPK